MKAVIVIPVEFDPDAGETLDMKLQVLMRGPKEHYNETGEQFTGPICAAVGPDMELILDVFKEPKSGGGRHMLRVDNERWHVEHSLVCRRAGLENCPITKLVSVGMDQPPLWEVGDHEVRLDDTGALLWGEDL